MTKTLLKVTIVCAAFSMSSSFSRAQPVSPIPNESSRRMQTGQSWSTKHLTATGRTSDSTVRASKLIGTQVNDLSGNRAGQIRDIVINPRSGRIDFALLSLNGASADADGNLVPVPWKLLRPSTTQYSDASSQPVFTLNVDQRKLHGAPTLSSTDLDQSQWRQRIYSYYGVTPQPAGSDPDEEETKGQGARSLQGHSPESPTPPPPPGP